MAATLTPTQERVLEFIGWFIEKNGYAPTRLDICKHMGAKSTNAANDWLASLKRKNLVHQTPVIARGLKLTSEGRTAIKRIAERKVLGQ